MRYERMSLNEYAALERENGARLYHDGQVWWREVRPFFYRPLYPFQALRPGEARIPLFRRLLGYQHLVPDAPEANSRMNFLVMDRLQDYSLDILPKKKRWFVRKAMKLSEVRPIDCREFIQAGYPVYLSFYRRTRYGWRSDRTDRRNFERWAESLYRHPSVRILGCYSSGGLNTIAVSYLIEDTIIHASLMSTDDALKLGTSDLVFHTIREAAAHCPEARYILAGAPGGRRSLDQFKMRRKCSLLNAPAHYWISPPALLLLKSIRPGNYRRLKGDLVYESSGENSGNGADGDSAGIPG